MVGGDDGLGDDGLDDIALGDNRFDVSFNGGEDGTSGKRRSNCWRRFASMQDSMTG